MLSLQLVNSILKRAEIEKMAISSVAHIKALDNTEQKRAFFVFISKHITENKKLIAEYDIVFTNIEFLKMIFIIAPIKKIPLPIKIDFHKLYLLLLTLEKKT